MGSAYLFTEEIVACGAIVPQFQQEVHRLRTHGQPRVGPWPCQPLRLHAVCAEFFRKRDELRAQKVAGDESRRVLDDLIMGRLRIASKGTHARWARTAR